MKPEKVQKWKNNRRARPTYDRKKGVRSDGAPVTRAYPVLNRGSRPCACGRTISANKTQCAKCAGVK